jgi:CBS-domain-containing membrane protein
MVLLYGLTAAPASQPRNAIVGNIIGMLVGMGISYLDDYLEVLLRMSLASATATALMVKIGVTHPPAGALALIFSTGTLAWSKVYIQLCGTIIAIAIGTVVNNLNPIRQYPTVSCC